MFQNPSQLTFLFKPNAIMTALEATMNIMICMQYYHLKVSVITK